MPEGSFTLGQAVASPPGGEGDRYGYAPLGTGAAGPSGGEDLFPGTQYVNLEEVFADGGYTSPKPMANTAAKLALWFSVFGVFLIPLVVSVILAVIGLVRARNLPDRIGTREASAALVYDGILVAIGVSIYLVGFEF